jgi:hypothetical protein
MDNENFDVRRAIHGACDVLHRFTTDDARPVRKEEAHRHWKILTDATEVLERGKSEALSLLRALDKALAAAQIVSDKKRATDLQAYQIQEGLKGAVEFVKRIRERG